MPVVPRLHVVLPFSAGAQLPLPHNASRHVQVLRLQPGARLTLFDGLGGEWAAQLLRIGRREVMAQLLAHSDVERELRCSVTLAIGMPANERMDTLIEKATELGVAAIVPLMCERGVLRLAGARAARKAAHWQAIAIAACEQSGRNRLPKVGLSTALAAWLATSRAPTAAPTRAPTTAPTTASASASPPVVIEPSSALAPGGLRLMLSLDPMAVPLLRYPNLTLARQLTLLSGPEGGLSAAEQALAAAHGFSAVSLGARVLRADTAPLAALACIAALEDTT